MKVGYHQQLGGEINVDRRKPNYLLLYTCTDFSLKTQDMRLVAEKSLQL